MTLDSFLLVLKYLIKISFIKMAKFNSEFV